MHFVHRPYQKDETIAAVTTPAGEGAIAVIRVSGSKTFDVCETLFSGPVKSYKTHTAHYGNILNKDGGILDSVLLLVMKGPHSYTGEDTVEISCHGGSLMTRRVLERVFEAGARPAEPGEFSFRAFINGKLDLAQAEAVQSLIAAKSERALENAGLQLQGNLSEKISSFQKELTELSAILEAWVDFPEEGLEFATMEEISHSLDLVCQKMEKLQATFHDGKVLHDGLSLCLLGSPNVGKSSLMNALLGKERAIVTPIAGTTRDLIEENLRIGGLHFRLIDTAGIRDTQEIIEQEGIRRSKIAVREADLILLLLDANGPVSEKDQALLNEVPKEKTILVWNKIDLAQPTESFPLPTAFISAKEKQGLDELKQAIERVVWKQGPPPKDEVAITQLRHHQALTKAIENCKTVIEGLKQNLSAEFVTADLRACLSELGTILGTNVTEDILTAIFSKFCLGK
jgi:tRNA modification GTPase